MRSNLKLSDRGDRSVGSFSFLQVGKPPTARRSLRRRLRRSSSWGQCFCGHSCGLLVGALEGFVPKLVTSKASRGEPSGAGSRSARLWTVVSSILLLVVEAPSSRVVVVASSEVASMLVSP
jgi:hypothetical protein